MFGSAGPDCVVFAPGIMFAHSVMVARQILTLEIEVRVLVGEFFAAGVSNGSFARLIE